MGQEILDWLLQNWETLTTAVIFIIVSIINFIKYIKAKDWNKVKEEISNLISVAELHLNYTGEEKKEYVLTKINQFAIEHKIKFDGKKASKAIDDLVKITKEVNKREKDIAAEKVKLEEMAEPKSDKIQ